MMVEFELGVLAPGQTTAELSLADNAMGCCDEEVDSISVEVPDENRGVVYFGYSGQDPDSGVGIIRTMGPGESYHLIEGGSRFRLGGFSIRVSNAAGVAKASAWRVA